MIRFFTPLRLALLAAMALTIIVGFIIVPAGTELPIHWGISGEADAFAGREVALLMPAAVVALVWVIFLAVGRFASHQQQEAGRHIAGVSLTALTGIFLAIEVMLVLIGAGAPLNVVQVLAVAFGVLMVVLGNAMPKSQPNSFAGIRMPTTLRNPANWQATHRLGGVLAIAGGVLLLVAALLVPPQQLILWLVACVLVPMIVAAGYSLAYARRHHP